MSKSLSGPLTKMDPSEAWKSWQPDPGTPWNLKWAGHLYRRAAFGATWDELQESVRSGHALALERVLTRRRPTPNEPDAHAYADQVASTAKQEYEVSTLQGTWLYRMIYSPHPLQEVMTLFWHNHFATSVAKVRQLALMHKQNQLIRKHALGKFRPFLLEMSKDPAMLIWLDSNSNVKSHPNENYARELMELFSLGVGNYTEKDIREAARAFTGWHAAGGEFSFNDVQHDEGTKTVLGKTGNWDGGDIVRIVLEQPAAARYLVRKLYRYFISENEPPPDSLLDPLAERLRKSDYDIADIVGTILRSRLFFSDHAYRQRVKSPVEFIVGLVRTLQADKDQSVGPVHLVQRLDGLGQALFAPPTVKGWDGGKAWLNSATHLARMNSAFMIVAGNQPEFSQKSNPATLVEKHGAKDAPKQVDFLLELFLQGNVGKPVREKLLEFLTRGDPKDAERTQRLRETAHMIVLLPEYQLA